MDYLGPFQTKLGKVKVLVNDGELFIRDLDHEELVDIKDSTNLTIFGVEYDFSWHCPYDAERGVYHDGGDKWHNHRPYLSRRHTFRQADTRGATWNKVVNVMLDLANSGIVTEEMRRQAKIERLERDIESLDKEIDENEEKHTELVKTRNQKRLEINQTKSLTNA